MTSIRQALSNAHHSGVFELHDQRLRTWPRELLDIPALGTISV
ncbi:hypothetical protein [Paractinoplanes ovalisporus]|nr:hypothetical protein [Actinoplanes ovalisporus]